MCGICGVWHGDAEQRVDGARLQRMTHVMRHRGPDGAGCVVDGRMGLGHRRLKIIDVSNQGRQPMGTPDGRHWLVFNGEIYNYRALRGELSARGYEFRSQTDTEVLLVLLAAEGVDGLSRLNGMFALAWWDRQTRELVLARDPYGIKPLYHAWHGSTLLFASEIKALLAWSGENAQVEMEALADYLMFQYALDEKTLFRGVHKVKPGHWLRLGSDGVLREGRYHRFDFAKTSMGEEEAVEELRGLLNDAVRLQLQSDVPLGCHLSGGMDSASIVGLATAALGRPVSTFTAGFHDGTGFDDTAAAKVTADHFHTHHHATYPDADDFARHFQRLIWHLDEPVAAPGSYAQYGVSRLAREHVTVVLGGQGADELMAGYARHYLLMVEAALVGAARGERAEHGFGVEDLAPNLMQLHNYQPMMRQFWRDGLMDPVGLRYLRLIQRHEDGVELLSGDGRRALGGYHPRDRFLELFGAAQSPEIGVLDRVLHFETTVWLPALLQVEDRTSMAWSLESRVPMLDTRIGSLMFSLPAAIKFRQGRLKHLLRRAMGEMLPPAIVQRRDKVGFPVPLHVWFAGPLREWLHHILMDRRALARGLLKEDRSRAALGGQDAYNRDVWGQLCLEMWLRLFVDGQWREMETDMADPAGACCKVLDLGTGEEA